MKKHFFTTFCGVVALCVALFGQPQSHVLDSVSVVGNRFDAFTGGMKRQVVESINPTQSATLSLSEMLLQSSPLLVRSSGAINSTSSVSLRGAGASRSHISWEGFPINSLTAGENDISTVPAQAFNYIAINHSASATQFGSGSFGGAIELQNRPDWQNRFLAQASGGIGSFGTYKAATAISAGNEHVQYNATFFYNQSENNFSYFDYIAQQERERKNAEVFGYGTMHNLHAQPTKNTLLHTSAWYQVKNLNLPAIVGRNPNNAENQVDSSLRTMVHFRAFWHKSTLSLRAAYIYDYLRYTKKLAHESPHYLTYSVIQSKRYLQTAQYRYFAGEHITLNTEVQNSVSKAEVLSYYAPTQEYALAGIAAAQYKQGNFQSNASLRKEYNSKYRIPFIFNIGAQQAVFAKRMLLRANVGSKYRTPTFNDLYWEGWGNPDLQPEHGYSAEGGVFNEWLRGNTTLTSDVTAFFSSINNMILWLPSGGVWHPLNIAQTHLRGVEAQVNHSYTHSAWQWRNALSANYNFSIFSKINTGDDSQMLNHALYYVPKLSANYSPQISYKHFSIGAMLNAQTARYYDLRHQLDAFCTIDAFTTYTQSWKLLQCTGSLACKNIGNTAYELTRSYPMPGRYWEINLKITI
ncbi:MAG: TonB-dependent receptor plug domain-containing protein [Bacteroidales bacterium]|jgi:outer membrane cobalamin receptor|nr:TonB-dependent receptor plug domain-containing protein [Bacteroidales bacterium]